MYTKIPKGKIRLDEYLINQGIVKNIKDAEALILRGIVLINEQKVASKAVLLDLKHDKVRVKKQNRFVSRAGEKLFNAILELEIKKWFQDQVVLDIGASTGGFCEVALSFEAAKVYALDVGINLLHHSLLTNAKIKNLAGEDIQKTNYILADVNTATADISFNSLERIAKHILRVAPRVSYMVLLLKPQFELPKEKIPKGGVITNESHIKALLLDIQAALLEQFENFKLFKIIPSKPKGKSGNQEYFFTFLRNP